MRADFIGSLFLSAEAVTFCLFAAGAGFLSAFYRQTERAVANAFFHHYYYSIDKTKNQLLGEKYL